MMTLARRKNRFRSTCPPRLCRCGGRLPTTQFTCRGVWWGVELRKAVMPPRPGATTDSAAPSHGPRTNLLPGTTIRAPYSAVDVLVIYRGNDCNTSNNGDHKTDRGREN